MIEFSTAFYIAFGFSLFAGIAGFYLGERGWHGVQNDLNNIKLDIANLKGSHGTVTTIPVVTPHPAGPDTPTA